MLSPDEEAVLGLEEVAILDAIRKFPGDVDAIHFMTGIPRSCVEVKVAALVELGYIARSVNGFEATKKDDQFRSGTGSP
ncbi:MAG: hypothetical protein GYA24_06230 [Candidatus Lokiarchaeota archaeon]|nr:hypothetical protein [Candidatus Lokiarchaeota archaeon]